jgi:hypothetical protein
MRLLQTLIAARWCSAKDSGCSKMASCHVASLWLQREARQGAFSSTPTARRPPFTVMFFVSREAAEEIMQARREFLDAIIVHYDTSMHNLKPKNII